MIGAGLGVNLGGILRGGGAGVLLITTGFLGAGLGVNRGGAGVGIGFGALAATIADAIVFLTDTGIVAGILGAPAFALTIDRKFREELGSFFLPTLLRPLLVDGRAFLKFLLFLNLIILYFYFS